MTENESVELSTKQRKAIRALLVKPTIQLAAKETAVSEQTLYRWLADTAFRRALTAAESAAIDTASRRLVTLTERAINTIEDILSDPETVPSIRLRAAIAVIENMLRLTELRTLEQRIAELEKRV